MVKRIPVVDDKTKLREHPDGRVAVVRDCWRWSEAGHWMGRIFDRSPAAVVVAFGALVLIAYANSFSASLTLDARFIIGGDPRIRAWSGGNLGLIFTENYWWPFTRGDLYRPLTTLSYLINYALLGNGDRVFGYHVVNFLLHWANVCLVFRLVCRLGGEKGLAWLAAALFAVHPVNVEAITNLVGRADLLAALAVLAAAGFYVKAAGERTGPRWRNLALAAAVACVGVFAKENAAMILALVLLYEAFLRPRPGGEPTAGVSAPRRIRELVTGEWWVFVPSIGLLLLARQLLGANLTPPEHSFVDNPILYSAPVQGTLTAIGVLGRDLGLLLWPGTLSCDYSYAQIPLYGEGASGWQNFLCWLSLAVVAALVVAAVYWRKKSPLPAWGVMVFFALVLPTSNLFLPIGSIMAERFLYLPSIGFCVSWAWVIRTATRQMTHRLGGVLPLAGPAISSGLPVLMLAALTVRTHARNADWQDETTIWKSAVVASPNSVKSHLAYAWTLWEDGRTEKALDAAIRQAEAGYAILDHASLPIERREQMFSLRLGNFYRLKGDFLAQRNAGADARGYFLKSIEVLNRAREVDRRNNQILQEKLRRKQPATPPPLGGNATIYNELALDYLRTGNWSQSAANAREMQRLVPSNADGYVLAAVAEMNLNNHGAAAVQFLAALILNSDDAGVRTRLEDCYARMGIETPFAPMGASYHIDTRNPRVREHVNQACLLLIRNHDQALLGRQAAQLREAATGVLNVPAELIPRAIHPAPSR